MTPSDQTRVRRARRPAHAAAAANIAAFLAAGLPPGPRRASGSSSRSGAGASSTTASTGSWSSGRAACAGRTIGAITTAAEAGIPRPSGRPSTRRSAATCSTTSRSLRAVIGLFNYTKGISRRGDDRAAAPGDRARCPVLLPAVLRACGVDLGRLAARRHFRRAAADAAAELTVRP